MVKSRVLKDASSTALGMVWNVVAGLGALLATPTVFKLQLFLNVFHIKKNFTTETTLAPFQISISVGIFNFRLAALIKIKSI
ncbi:hypothetical protein LCR01_13960 [Companilactobacillus crustorum]|uniref:Uncharacterized protein n=2 Tax=Companilactobacillus TaxID=2767879 RepID=A0A2P4R6R7_9LACO|nr:hypothetical protein LCR01_13960 [Companilactobacillus crustorum]